MTTLAPRLVLVCAAVSAVPSAAQDWRLVSSGRPNGDNSAAWDPVRERLVLFDSSRSTWEWDGQQWWMRPAGPATPWGGAELAWDPVSQRIVAFGGLVTTIGTGVTNETWAYDGVSWKQLQPANRPLARYRHAMATDTARGRIVLFGGDRLCCSILSETWEWTGSDWVQVAPAGSGPPGLDGARMAYDPVRQRCVLFGGNRTLIAYYGAYFPDTWEWDGSRWQLISNGAPPVGREGHGLAFDPRRGRVLLHGGFTRSGLYGAPSPPRSDTWEWNGAAWQSLGNGPPISGSMADATSLGSTVFASSGAGTTWVFDGSTWTQPEQLPTPVVDPAIAYDPARGRAVTHLWNNETWEHDGLAWRRVATASPVSNPTDSTLAHDASRPGSGEVLLFDGSSTYVWDGAAWSASPATGPGGNGAMAADTVRAEVVLLTDAGETWIWRAGSWTRRAVSGPPPRSGAGMAFDPLRGVAVLFGGLPGGSLNALDDTWVWDGSQWSLVPTASTPPPRFDHGLAFDSVAGQVVLCGGYTSRAGSPATGMWAFDGASWALRTTTAEPSTEVAMTEMAPGRIVALSWVSGVWEYDARISATTSRFGTGCGREARVPDLDAFGLPRAGRAAFSLDAGRLPATAPAVILLAAGPGNAPLTGGCTVYVDPSTTVSVPVATGPTGAASLALPIPVAIAAGTTLHAQAAGLDPGAPLGLALTRRVTFGIGR